jgi:hypothetical protein
MYSVTKKSGLSGKENTMEFPDELQERIEDWFALRALGTAPYVQNAFPDLDAGQREFLMTGSTPAEWTEYFGEEE